MAEDIPVTLDGQEIGAAKVIGDGILQVILYDSVACDKITQGTLMGISISDKGLGNIELV